ESVTLPSMQMQMATLVSQRESLSIGVMVPIDRDGDEALIAQQETRDIILQVSQPDGRPQVLSHGAHVHWRTEQIRLSQQAFGGIIDPFRKWLSHSSLFVGWFGGSLSIR